MAVIDEKLLELTEENEKLKATIERMTTEAEEMQVDYANKIATAKVEYETKELKLKKQIKDLTVALELRNSNERQINKKNNNKSANQVWEEIMGDTK